MKDILILAKQLGAILKQKHFFLATAESCTGGQIAQSITAIPGSSNWFDRGFVTYSNAAKQEMLGISENLILSHGAVSEEVALAMAKGALQNSSADVSIAVTGIAGPDGGSEEKPVGTVWLAWGSKQSSIAKCFYFTGDRLSIREQAVSAGLQGLQQILTSI